VQRVLIGIGFVLMAVVSCQLMFSDDRDAVEDEMERLFDLARTGGEDAVAEILEAFADDYRGTGSFSIERVERTLRRALLPEGTLKKLEHGDFEPIATGEEIEIPIVSVSADVRGQPVRAVFRFTWGRRDGSWKIVDVTRWRSRG
jgi:hypothetical protein